MISRARQYSVATEDGKCSVHKMAPRVSMRKDEDFRRVAIPRRRHESRSLKMRAAAAVSGAPQSRHASKRGRKFPVMEERQMSACERHFRCARARERRDAPARARNSLRDAVIFRAKEA